MKLIGYKQNRNHTKFVWRNDNDNHNNDNNGQTENVNAIRLQIISHPQIFSSCCSWKTLIEKMLIGYDTQRCIKDIAHVLNNHCQQQQFRQECNFDISQWKNDNEQASMLVQHINKCFQFLSS
jgi:hypothetical protein